jgi:hypothetical protein
MGASDGRNDSDLDEFNSAIGWGKKVGGNREI